MTPQDEMEYRGGRPWNGSVNTLDWESQSGEAYTLKDGEIDGDRIALSIGENGEHITLTEVYENGRLKYFEKEIERDPSDGQDTTSIHGVTDVYGRFTGKQEDFKFDRKKKVSITFEQEFDCGELVCSVRSEFDHLKHETTEISINNRPSPLQKAQKEVRVIRENGECTVHRDGILAKKYMQKNGAKDGVYESYYANGQLKHRAIFVESHLSGLDTHYDELGRTIQRSFWRDGKDISPSMKLLNISKLREVAAENVGYDKDKVSMKRSRLAKIWAAIKLNFLQK